MSHDPTKRIFKLVKYFLVKPCMNCTAVILNPYVTVHVHVNETCSITNIMNIRMGVISLLLYRMDN